MSLNIKNKAVHELVRELSRRTGMSQTSVVEDAVRRRLEQLEADGDRTAEIERRVAAIDRTGAEIRAGLTEEDLEHMRRAGEWLYDENGLPA